MTGGTRRTSRLWLKRSVLGLGALAGGALTIVLVLVLLLLFPPIRSMTLREVLSRTKASLPGSLTVQKASWPSIGTIDLEGIEWTDGADSLASAGRVCVSVELTSFLKRDIRVESVLIEGLLADIPAITARFPHSDGPRPEKEEKRSVFPRSGSLPFFPSVAVERIRVTAPAILVSNATTMNDVTIDAGLDISHGAAPWLRVDTLKVRGPEGTWRVDELTLYIAPDRGLIKGHGKGAVSPDWPLDLSLTPLGRDHFKLNLSTSTRESAAPPEETGLDLDLELAREGLRVRTVSFDGRVRTPGTRELSKDPEFAPRVDSLPDLDGLDLGLRGTIGFGKKFNADLSCDIEKNNWLDGGEFLLKYNEEGLSLSKIVIAMPGLSLAGEASMNADSVTAAAELRVNGTRWAKILLPDVELPKPLFATIAISAARATGHPTVRADLNAEGDVAGFSINRFHVKSELSLDGAAPSRVVLTTETRGVHVGVAAEILRKTDISVSVTPIVLREAPLSPSSIVFSREEAGTIRYSTTNKNMTVDGVRVTGDFGDLAVDAELDPRRQGAFSLAYRLRTPPTVLARALGLSEENEQQFRKDWAIDGPFSVDVEGELALADGPHVAASGTFSLPGPRNLALLLPDSARIDDLGPLAGTFSLSTTPGAQGIRFDTTADLGATKWIDSSAVHLIKRGAAVVIDTAGVAFKGITVGVSGTVEHRVFDVAANVAVSDSKWFQRFSRSVPDVEIRGKAHFRGTPKRPTLDAKVEGSIKGTNYRVPEFTAIVGLDTTRVTAVVRAPRGISTPLLRLNRVDAELFSIVGRAGIFPIRLSLDAAGENLALHQSLRADTAGGVSVEVDTLDLTVAGQDLRTRKPFRIHLLSDRQGISIEDAELAGTLGTVRMSGTLRPDSSNVSGAVEVTLPEKPPPAFTRPHLWPERLDLEFEAKGTDDVAARLDVRGFMLVDQSRPTLHVEISGDADGIEGALSVADSSEKIVTSHGRFPASVRIYPPSLVFRDGPISFDALLNRVPAVTRVIGPAGKIPRDEIIRIGGHVTARGTAASPTGFATLSFEFADWPKMSQYRAVLEAALGAPTSVDSLETHDGAGVSPELKVVWEEQGGRGLSALLRLEREGRPVLTARAHYPLYLSLHPPVVRTTKDGRIDLRVESEEIPLADFDPLLPLNVGLGGLVTVKITASGPPEDLAIDGALTTKGLEVSVAQKARLAARSDIRLSGSSRRSTIKGDVEIASGLIRVPDMPKNLHALEGKALLWRDSLAVTGRDTVAAVETAPGRTEKKEERRIEPDIDVSIHIPSGFWIRGRGLDVELAGDLHVKQLGGKPIVTGELRAVRGNLVLLGRTLDLDRGTVTFYGEDEVNPSLDIMLTTNVEGTKIQILFGGTVQKPQITMTSEPDMSETDIMSVLLFGRAFNDLDDDQASLVRQRSAEMIASLGAAKLQKELGGQLGVDVVTVKSVGKDNASTALSFGKYLNTRTLLGYAYSLDSESRSFVSLEYFLKGRFVIGSTYDNEGLGSLGVGWSKDY